MRGNAPVRCGPEAIPEWTLPDGVSLANAQFTIKYYDSIITNGNSIPSSAVRTWEFKTNEYGIIRYASSYKSSGPDLFTNSLGRSSLPAGTIVIEETTPPSGFFVNTNKYILTITIADNGAATWHEYEYDGSTTTDRGVIKTLNVSQTADLDTQVKELLKPVISTVALNNITGTHVGVTRTNDTVTDTVYIEYALPGTAYTLKAELRDADTGDLISTVTRDTTAPRSSNAYVGYEVTMPPFRFNSSDFTGRTVVVYEYMYYKDGAEVISEHAELVEEQMIRYPEVTTEAIDADTGNHAGTVKEEATVKDSVQCSNLVVGQEYTVNGTLRYQEDFTDANGTSHKKEDIVELKDGSVTEKTFTATASHMEIELTFIVDSTLLEGTTVVAFEDLYAEDINVATHSDIDDESQSVHYPEISTTASDTDITEEVGMSARNAGITDEVRMHNLVPGTTYTVTGRLFRQSDGTEFVQTGIEMIPETFTAEAADETHYVTFTGIDATAIQGDSLVVYEQLIVNDEVVTKHEDINDTAQTVHYPGVQTEAVDAVTETHQGTIFGQAINWIRTLLGEEIPAEGNQVVVDRVTLTNLVPGKTYTVEGVLMNRATGEPLLVNDEEITQSATVVVTEDGQITAPDGEKVTTTESDPAKQRVSGMVELTFAFDSAELIRYNTEEEEQTDLVAYEVLKYNGIEIASHRDINDDSQTVYEPVIRTTAVDAATEDHVGDVPKSELAPETIEDSESSQITDTVTMDGLIAGEDYILMGYLVSRDDSTAEKPMYITADGTLSENVANAVTSQLTFTAADKAEEQVVTFDLSSSLVAGKTVVVFEVLHDAKGNPLTNHADLTDEAQSIWYPLVETTAFVIETSTEDEPQQKTAPVEAETISITDIVDYSNTIPEEEYTIVGHLAYTEDGVDADGNEHTAGEFLVNADGEPYEASAILEAGEHEVDGTIEFTFEIDQPQLLAGITVVAFEEMYHGGAEVAAHADLTDEDQEVHFPEIETELTDKDMESHTARADEDITLVDTVYYHNLVSGEIYTVKGKLYDQKTGKPFLDDNGKEITSELVGFVPEEPDGSVELEFTFKGTKLAGTTTVAFEDLYHGDVLVRTHADIDDDLQTLHFPEIGTTLTDNNGLKNFMGSKSAVISDKVVYRNLAADESYTIFGHLIDKVTGDIVATGYTTFRPEEADGSVIVTFDGVDTYLYKGHELVAFEYLYFGELIDEPEKTEPKADHEEIDDVAQTVYIPQIGTKAYASDETKQLEISENAKLTDTIAYNALMPKTEYRVVTTLWDRTAGDYVEGVEVEHQVKLDETNGEFEVEITFNTTALEGHEIVVLEKLYQGDTLLAYHTDANDEAQTVYVPELPRPKKDAPSTGDRNNTVLWMGITLICLLAIMAGVYDHRRIVKANDSAAKRRTTRTRK